MNLPPTPKLTLSLHVSSKNALFNANTSIGAPCSIPSKMLAIINYFKCTIVQYGGFIWNKIK